MPIGCFKGIVIGKLLSAENRTDNDMDRQREWRTSRIRLLFRGYPPEFIERVRLAWLAKRRAPPSSRRDSSHTALSQDMLGETFVVLDHCDSLPTTDVARRIDETMGLSVKIAVRYHASVGAALRGMAKKAIPSLKPMMRSRTAVVPPRLAQLWLEA